MTSGKGVHAVLRLRPDRRDEGAAAVEFALLFPIFMILAMGIITTGTAFSRQINVTQAAREASRYGATYSVVAAGGLSPWLTAVDGALCRSVNNGNACSATQATNPLAGYNYRCVALLVKTPANAIDPTRSGYMEDGGSVVTGASCPTVTTPDFGGGSKVVQVVLSRDVNFFVVFANPTLHLDGVSTTPYEEDLTP